MENNENTIFEQKFRDHKEYIEKEIATLIKRTDEQEQRIQLLERSKEKTDFQYEQIIKTLDTLNKDTIPKLAKEIEELKNRPVKRYDQLITVCISTLVGGVLGFIINMFFGGK